MMDKAPLNGQRGASKATPEMLALMVDLLPTIGSLRDLCAITGLRLDAVRREVAPFLTIMKLTGTHPRCGCGRDRFHPYGCADRGFPSDLVPGRTRAESAVLMARREAAIEMLVAGDRLVDVDLALGMSKGGAKNYVLLLTPEQLATRTERQRERSARTAQPRATS